MSMNYSNRILKEDEASQRRVITVRYGCVCGVVAGVKRNKSSGSLRTTTDQGAPTQAPKCLSGKVWRRAHSYQRFFLKCFHIVLQRPNSSLMRKSGVGSGDFDANLNEKSGLREEWRCGNSARYKCDFNN